MNEDNDIEKMLKQYNPPLGEHVKRSVLVHYNSIHRARTSSFWKKPVPLYKVVAAMIIVAALSFSAGKALLSNQWLIRSLQDEKPVLLKQEMKPVIAVNELL